MPSEVNPVTFESQPVVPVAELLGMSVSELESTLVEYTFDEWNTLCREIYESPLRYDISVAKIAAILRAVCSTAKNSGMYGDLRFDVAENIHSAFTCPSMDTEQNTELYEQLGLLQDRFLDALATVFVSYPRQANDILEYVTNTVGMYDRSIFLRACARFAVNPESLDRVYKVIDEWAIRNNAAGYEHAVGVLVQEIDQYTTLEAVALITLFVKHAYRVRLRSGLAEYKELYDRLSTILVSAAQQLESSNAPQSQIVSLLIRSMVGATLSQVDSEVTPDFMQRMDVIIHGIVRYYDENNTLSPEQQHRIQQRIFEPVRKTLSRANASLQDKLDALNGISLSLSVQGALVREFPDDVEHILNYSIEQTTLAELSGEDAQSVRQLIATNRYFLKPESIAKTIELFDNARESNNEQCVILRVPIEHGTKIGAVMTWHDEPDGSRYIGGLAFSTELQNPVIAETCIKPIIEQLGAEKQLVAVVAETNLALSLFINKWGFKQDGLSEPLLGTSDRFVHIVRPMQDSGGQGSVTPHEIE